MMWEAVQHVCHITFFIIHASTYHSVADLNELDTIFQSHPQWLRLIPVGLLLDELFMLLMLTYHLNVVT